jgi:hypothetical protein
VYRRQASGLARVGVDKLSGAKALTGGRRRQCGTGLLLVAYSGQGRVLPGGLPLGTDLSIGGSAVSRCRRGRKWLQTAVNGPGKRCACSADLKRWSTRPRLRVGRVRMLGPVVQTFVPPLLRSTYGGRHTCLYGEHVAGLPVGWRPGAAGRNVFGHEGPQCSQAAAPFPGQASNHWSGVGARIRKHGAG